MSLNRAPMENCGELTEKGGNFTFTMPGSKVTVEASFKAEENVIAGNVIGYGGTSGKIFINGMAGERFAITPKPGTDVLVVVASRVAADVLKDPEPELLLIFSCTKPALLTVIVLVSLFCSLKI